MSEINTTPFVDVMLVLLIIFMVTAPLLTVGVQVDLPGPPQTLYRTTRAINFKHKLKRRNLYSRTSSNLPKNNPKLLAIAKNRTDTRIYVEEIKILIMEEY